MAFVLHTVYSIRSSSNLLRTLKLADPPISLSFSRRSLVVKATETGKDEVRAKAPDKAPTESGSSINQILGIKGAKQETDKWKIRVQLMKPVSWPPLVWGVVCGAAAFGAYWMWAGQALFGTLTLDIVFLTLLYSIAGSLPVAFGTETAKWICFGAIDVTQLSVKGYLLVYVMAMKMMKSESSVVYVVNGNTKKLHLSLS